MDIKGELIGLKEVTEKIMKGIEQVHDLTPVFLTIMSDWYKDNEEIFLATEGPGQYEELSPEYFEYKERTAPNGAYPILEFDGYLRMSLTNPGDEGAYHVISPTVLVMGTLIPYAIYHQSSEPRTKIPYRPFIFNKKVSGGFLHIYEARTARYLRALETYIQRRLKVMYPKGQGGN
jgi:phage gpG-like protein